MEIPAEEVADISLNPDAALEVSDYYKRQLRIQSLCRTDLVEISPLVSYDGKEGIS
jgi:hypothetical protein